MADLSELQSKVLGMQQKERNRREENRARMPKVATFVDAMKAEFGDELKVLWASENGVTLGERQKHDWIQPSLPVTLTARATRRK